MIEPIPLGTIAALCLVGVHFCVRPGWSTALFRSARECALSRMGLVASAAGCAVIESAARAEGPPALAVFWLAIMLAGSPLLLAMFSIQAAAGQWQAGKGLETAWYAAVATSSLGSALLVVTCAWRVTS